MSRELELRKENVMLKRMILALSTQALKAQAVEVDKEEKAIELAEENEAREAERASLAEAQEKCAGYNVPTAYITDQQG